MVKLANIARACIAIRRVGVKPFLLFTTELHRAALYFVREHGVHIKPCSCGSASCRLAQACLDFSLAYHVIIGEPVKMRASRPVSLYSYRTTDGKHEPN